MDPLEHDLGLIDELLALTPEERLFRLAAAVRSLAKLREAMAASRP